MKKILSLCYPTYNRGWCIKKQILQLKCCPSVELDKIEIIISDNCSTDDTAEIVNEAIKDGFPCKYYRNSENIGMDGNFVSCFNKATGKYVWLLGDDDIIIIDSLLKIIHKLEENEEYGLLHVNMNMTDNEPAFIKYMDDDEFCKKVNVWFSFISGNIAQTKYVKDVDFTRYMGTWFTLIPLYFESLHNEKTNLLINFKVFDCSLDGKRNGGYNFFQVFGVNFNSIMKEYADKKYITDETSNYLKKMMADYNVEAYIDFVILGKDSNYNTDNATSIIFKVFGTKLYFYNMFILKLFGRLFKRINRLV